MYFIRSVVYVCIWCRSLGSGWLKAITKSSRVVDITHAFRINLWLWSLSYGIEVYSISKTRLTVRELRDTFLDLFVGIPSRVNFLAGATIHVLWIYRRIYRRCIFRQISSFTVFQNMRRMIQFSITYFISNLFFLNICGWGFEYIANRFNRGVGSCHIQMIWNKYLYMFININIFPTNFFGIKKLFIIIQK